MCCHPISTFLHSPLLLRTCEVCCLASCLAHWEVHKLRKQDRAREQAAARFKAEEHVAVENKDRETKKTALDEEKKSAATATTTSAASTMTASSSAPTTTTEKTTVVTEKEKERK
jgi:hypothetical protein